MSVTSTLHGRLADDGENDLHVTFRSRRTARAIRLRRHGRGASTPSRLRLRSRRRAAATRAETRLLLLDRRLATTRSWPASAGSTAAPGSACAAPLELDGRGRRASLRGAQHRRRRRASTRRRRCTSGSRTRSRPRSRIVSGPADDRPRARRSSYSRVDRAGATAECRLDGGALGAVRLTRPLLRGWRRATTASRCAPSTRAGRARSIQWLWRIDPHAARHADRRRAVRERLAHVALDRCMLRFEVRDPGRGRGRRSSARAYYVAARCRLDGGPWLNCSRRPRRSPAWRTAEHVVEALRASTRRGNVDQTPARFVWTVGVPVPDTAIDFGPGAVDGDREALFALRAVGEFDGFECRLDRRRLEACCSGRDALTRRTRRRAPARGAGAQRKAATTPSPTVSRLDGRRASVGDDRLRPAAIQRSCFGVVLACARTTQCRAAQVPRRTVARGRRRARRRSAAQTARM